MKLGGLIDAGKVKADPNIKPVTDFGEAKGALMEGTTAFRIPLNLIDDSPYQPRRKYDDKALQELAATMAKAGQQEPIKVRQMADLRYQLISGHRRVRAARINSMPDILAYVFSMQDDAAEQATMLANESRENLTDYERAKLYQLAVERGLARTQRDIAAYFGASQARVSKCLSMLTLPEEYIRQLEENPAALTAREAIELRDKLDNPALQLASTAELQPSPAPQPESAAPKPKRTAPVRRTPSVITTSSGQQVFTARASGREIAVRINDVAMDAETVKRAIVETLKRLAEEADQKL